MYSSPEITVTSYSLTPFVSPRGILIQTNVSLIIIGRMRATLGLACAQAATLCTQVVGHTRSRRLRSHRLQPPRLCPFTAFKYKPTFSRLRQSFAAEVWLHLVVLLISMQKVSQTQRSTWVILQRKRSMKTVAFDIYTLSPGTVQTHAAFNVSPVKSFLAASDCSEKDCQIVRS